MAPERRFDRGSWVALLYAFFIFSLITIFHLAVWRTPSDGWVSRIELPGGASLQANLLGLTSDLQPGDRVLEINGEPVLDYARAAYSWRHSTSPDWHDGQILQYKIQRGDKQIVLDVPIRRFSPGEQIVASLKAAVGVDHPGAALLEVAASLVFFVVSLFAFVLRPRERGTQALLIIGAAFFFQHYYLVTSLTLLAFPFALRFLALFEGWLWAILPALSYLMLAFPQPAWLVRRFPGLTVVLLFGFSIATLLVPNLMYPDNLDRVLALLRQTTLLMLVYLAIPIIALTHSWRVVRDPLARMQLKWVTLGTSGFIAGGLAFTVGQFTGWSLGISLLQNIGYLSLPVCIAIAVLRYRLFDIDVIIRRTLVYGALTGILAGLYFSSVVLLQEIVHLVTGQIGQSPLMIVLSTLGIAALFNPLRRRVQGFIDRRFYRRNYDSERTLQEFAASLRNEVDLDVLSNQVEATVSKTMQPLKVQLWLRSSPSVAASRFSVGGGIEKAGEGGSE